MNMYMYTIFPQIVYVITTNLEQWVSVNTKRRRILNEGDYNYVEQCNFKARIHEHESFIVTYSIQQLQLVQKVRILNSQFVHLQLIFIIAWS